LRPIAELLFSQRLTTFLILMRALAADVFPLSQASWPSFKSSSRSVFDLAVNPTLVKSPSPIYNLFSGFALDHTDRLGCPWTLNPTGGI